jgi:type I restriction enzyme S subunit
MNVKVMPGYKQTEVGVIPDDWEIKSLGSIALIATGNTPPTRDAENYGDEFLFVSPVDLGFSKYISRTEKMLSQKGFSISRPFPKGSILFVCIGSTIGKCGIASETLTSNQQINAILPSAGLSSDYLYYAASAVAPKVKSLAGEQAVPIVNKTQFSETAIPLPPTLAEQEAIAEALSDADNLIESLEQLIVKKRQIKQGAMQELLIGKKRLLGFGGEWEVKSFGELGSTYGGLTGKTKIDFGQGSAKYIPFLNVINNVVIELNQLESVSVHLGENQNLAVKGDLFFNGSSETPEEVGMCAVLLDDVEDVYLNSFCFGFRLHLDAPVVGLYLAYFFRSGVGRKLLYALAQGATRHNLSKTALMALKFGLPTPDEQTAIAAILSDMDAEITALEAKLAKARQLKQGMMQELLTGRIRLK